MCAFSDSRSFEKTFAEVTWFFSLFARYRAGSEPCRSGSVIGSSLAVSMAPMAQSGGDGRWRHRAQACFLVALLYSSAPCWRYLRGWRERRRYTAFAGWGALVLKGTGERGSWGELVQVEGGSPLSILLWEVVNGSYGAGRASGVSNGGRAARRGLSGWIALVCWQAEGAQMGFCAPCRYSDQGALLFTGIGIFDTALCTFWSRSGSLHGAAWSVLAERRRNEASSSREGGGRLAVRWWLAFRGGCCGNEGSAGQR